MKKCKCCKTPFTPTRPMQNWCSVDCAVKLGEQAIAKKKTKEQAADRKETREKLDAMRTRSQHIKECQILVNKYVRLRDIRKGLGCVSCGASYRDGYGGLFDAGHLRSTGSAPQLRFMTTQISLQCVKCNRYGGGRAFEFRAEMIKRMGQEWMDQLESMNGTANFTIEYLTRLKAIMRRKIKRLGEK